MTLQKFLELIRSRMVTVGEYNSLFNLKIDKRTVTDARRRLRADAQAETENPRAWAALGAAELKAFEFLDAMDAFEKALELDQRCLAAWAGMAMCHFYCSDSEMAIEAFTRVLDMNPDDGTAWMFLGNSHEGLVDGPCATIAPNTKQATMQYEAALLKFYHREAA